MSPRIGLFGGTFDPPHNGHLAVARAVRDQLHLDTVLLEVAHDPWQKQESLSTPSETRLEMVRALCADEPGVMADDREIRRGGPTYSVDTVREILAEVPGAEVFLVIGEDSAHRFHTWRDHENLAVLSTLVVVNRPDHVEVTPTGVSNFIRVTMNDVPVSSTQIREAVASGRDITNLTSRRVVDIIEHRGLYGVSR